MNEDRHVGFDLKTAKSILKSLAAFHATGFGIKYKQPEKFQIIKDTFKNAMPDSEGPPPDDGPPEHIVLQKIIELHEFQPYKSQLQTLKKNLLPLIQRYMGGGLEPWNTVVHGDFWGNNIMVTKNGEPVAVKILDFQTCKYLTYVRDVVFFLLTSLRDDVFQQSFDYLLR